ncbi:TIGR03862 family flavoprotein, partial [Lishizhenia sp.]|uniref:NAD(P)/FAD-dependent oxidoreductase n=1 Tax=Lishizhenia sp. TaxID=2497594 RepID=UPI00299CE54B
MSKKSIAVIGLGPAALFFAAFVDTTKYQVTIYEKKKQGGRKFLVAGKGGFNLTHSEPIDEFIARYTPYEFLAPALRHFSNGELRNWLKEIGIPTIIGSSHRVYPEDHIKPIEVLNTLLEYVQGKGVEIVYEHEWIGWGEKHALRFAPDTLVKADKVVFALGGGSWKITGSDGAWLDAFEKQGVKVLPFKASNCAYTVDWEKQFIAQNTGQPLKNCSYSAGGQTQKGEVVITENGIEGNAVYALSPDLRNSLEKEGSACLEIDFKPSWPKKKVLDVLQNSRLTKMTDILKKDVRLSKVQINLLKAITSKEEFLSKKHMAHLIKIYPLQITGQAPLDEAISTVGGVPLDALNERFELKVIPHHYCIGEML